MCVCGGSSGFSPMRIRVPVFPDSRGLEHGTPLDSLVGAFLKFWCVGIVHPYLHLPSATRNICNIIICHYAHIVYTALVLNI